MIVLLGDMPADVEQRTRRIAPEMEVVRGLEGGQMLEGAVVVVGRPDFDDLESAGRLRWLQLSSAGANQYVDRVPEHVLLTTASGVYGIPVAEHVFAMMLGLVRGVPESVRSAAERHWNRDARYDEIYGRTCGVLGFGDIGREVARRASAFGMRVLALKRTAADPPAFVEEVFGMDRLGDFLAACDHIVNTLPDTPHTQHVIDADAFASVRRGSYFYNVGRGRTVDEAALIDALHSGRLAGAGLDVFEEEPLPEESPLWSMANVILTPHVGGATPREAERVAGVFLENLQRWVDGRSLMNVVDRKLGY